MKKITKILIVSFCIFLLSLTFVYSQTYDPSASAETCGGGEATWGTTSNAFSSNDVRATSDQAKNKKRCVMRLTAVPTGSIIDGITVSIERSAEDATSITDFLISLTKDGTTAIGSDLSKAGAWPLVASEASETYGGAANLWGTTWTDAEINAGTFGVLIQVFNSHGSQARQAHVDHVTITVDYTPPSPSASGGIGAFIEGDATPVTISDLVIDEAVASNFVNAQTSETYIILPPAGFTFNAGIGSA